MSFCPACRSEYPDEWKRCPTDEAALLPQRNLGKYRVDAVIGIGGMGAVYKAFNPDTQSPVAIKLMHAEASAQQASRERFKREAASVAAVKTRHLVSIYDFGNLPDGTLFLVMEYLDGHTLRDEIEPGGMPPARINMIMDGTLRGLGAAHRKSIVHRDLKPENIFIAQTEDGEVVKLLDFGIAQVQSGGQHTLTKDGAIMGTPAYMAPEQVAGNRGEVGSWSDVYSMGVILHEMFTGVAPFHDDSVTAILSKVLTRDYQPLRTLRPELSNAVLGAIDCAMADHYDDRFADADAFRDAWAAAAAVMLGGDDAPVPAFRRTRDARTVGSPSGGIDPLQATGIGNMDTFLSPAEGVRAETPDTRAVETRVGHKVSTATPTRDPEPAAPSRGPLLVGLGVAGAIAAVAAFFLLRGGNGSTPEPLPSAVGFDAAVPVPIDAAPPPPELAADMVTLGPGTYAVTGFPVAAVARFQLDKTEMTTRTYRAATGGEGGDELPIREVTWDEAGAACAALGKRLPSELEWEYAATRTVLDSGDAQLFQRGVSGPAPVATHPGDCTPEGLCDLLGNVSEWTADAWRVDASGATDDRRRVVRGGSFNVAVSSPYAKPQSRSRALSGQRDPELGFRCARDLSAEEP
ncbi:MAG TPA: bifunctional serine/threonine-protein kinase/formylglycine-generating enzyme family protein [Kofleriaceae bacterium]|nr:bifunctional serine/threonine-protein kinase/formylglycine-generating enzyme family protein [Kofleriaceae bacterium]